MQRNESRQHEMCECERTTFRRGSDVDVSEGREGYCVLRLRNERVVSGNSWCGVIKGERFKLGHFVQSGQPIPERQRRLRRGPDYLEALQALEEWRLASDIAAVQIKMREVGCSSVEKGIRDDVLWRCIWIRCLRQGERYQGRSG